MLRSYLAIALRNLMRNKVVTGINIAGMSVAIAVSAILGIGVYGMLTADWNLREDDRLFRVVTREILASGKIQRSAWHREDLASALAETFPGIASTARVIKTYILMTVGERHLEYTVVEVDPPFLEMFHYPLAAGNPAAALDGLDQVVISKRLAAQMFVDEFGDYPELVGREIVLHGDEGPEAYTISGVLADLPKQRSLDFDAAIRFENREKYGMTSYWGATASTYIALHPLAERKALEAQLPEFSRAFIAPIWESNKGVRWKDDPDAFQLELQDARTIYLDPQAQTYYGYEQSLPIEGILALVALIGVILTVACLNFTTLALAGSIGRSMEVGVRKALGANKAHIALQFLGEGVLLAFFSLVVGLVLAQLGLPAFNACFGLDDWSGLALHDLDTSIIIGGGILSTVLIGRRGGNLSCPDRGPHAALVCRPRGRALDKKQGDECPSDLAVRHGRPPDLLHHRDSSAVGLHPVARPWTRGRSGRHRQASRCGSDAGWRTLQGGNSFPDGRGRRGPAGARVSDQRQHRSPQAGRRTAYHSASVCR